ncbi:MAG TPA: hypothetical protein IGS40_25700 [Trichormus sp. M33_DOE_039]|nr:hypothetical protein [Trichormus sp. M33_DOE_039]
MKDVKPSELNQRRYSLPLRLNLLMMASVLGVVNCNHKRPKLQSRQI